MRVFAADLPKIVIRIVFAALIAHHHARGYAGRPHQSYERIGIMFAKTLAAFKQKAVGGVFHAQHGRLERVGKFLFLEILISSLHKGQRIAAALLIQLFGQCVCFQIGIFG